MRITMLLLGLIFLSIGAWAMEPEQRFKTLCMACHTEQTGGGPGNRVAPPPFALKLHYIEHFKDKEIFIKAMSRYLQNPNKEDSLMPEAVEKFGLMNKMAFEAKDYEALAGYIFDTEFKTPGWYSQHRKEECRGNKAFCEKILKTGERLRKLFEKK